MTNKELKKLAMDISEGKVFGTWNMDESESSNIPMVFMVMNFMKPKQYKEYLIDTAHIYEYMEKANRRSMNGYPSFMSCQKITIKEWEILVPLVEKAKKMKEQFLKT